MNYLGGGTTHDAYLNWAKRHGALIQEEAIAHEARILWIGERGTKKVILYFHGGGYLSSVQGFQLDYVSGMLGRLRKSGKSVSIALLEYSLSNIATFPIQLKQGVAAIQYLFELGYDPSDIVLVGDSAGGNLLFQLLLHILHPVDDVDRLEVFSEGNSAFAGAFAMSPWLGLSNTDARSWEENKYFDIADGRGLSGLAQLYLHGVPQWAYRYVDPASSTPATWFKGVDGIVRKVLITAGQRECLRDDIIKVGEYMTDHHPLGTTVIVQEGGLHVDVMLDMPLNQSPPVELTDTIFKWLIEVI
ncbi:alpha/beta-hydrolase [Coprinellus micaceus]|uniref:Alpha/beta-hydrolase n=1 Tax=Coprinellus micaceus TaxID=71717 RepID=A0A4Y7TK62_COPMI|nr:alpha/beta-hydrolase [Coprinellus micaceus]